MENNIKRGISLYRIFSRAYFHLPFLVIFLHKQNYSIIDIEIIMAIYGISIFLYTKSSKSIKITSILSHKHILILSEFIKIIGLSIMLISKNITGLVFSQFFLGIGYGFSAGIDSQIINKYISDNGKFQSKSNSYMFISLLTAGLLGSFLFNYNIRLPFIASIAAALIAIVSCIIFLPSEKMSIISEYKDEKKLFTKKESEIVYTYSFSRGIILTFFSGFLPYHLFVDLSISIYAFILILTSYTFVGNLSSKYIFNFINDKTALLIMKISLILSIIMFFSNNLISIIIGTLLLGLTSGAVRPICYNQLKNLNSNISVISNVMESIYSIINVSILLIGGFLYEKYSFNALLMILIITFIIYLVKVLTLYKYKQREDFKLYEN